MMQHSLQFLLISISVSLSCSSGCPPTPDLEFAVDHGTVDCSEEGEGLISTCWLECDGGWVNNGTYAINCSNNTDIASWLQCAEPATLVLAGYSTKPEDGSSGRVDSVELYKSWSFSSSPPSSLPLTRSYHTATTVGNTVYVTGGQINDFDENGEVVRGVYTATSIKYNPLEDTWQSIGNMSFARWWHSAAQWRNYVYVMGGRHGYEGTVVNSVERFDVAKEVWSHGPVGTTPHPVYGHCSVTFKNKLYLLGGVNDDGYLATLHGLDPREWAWTQEQSMAQARVHHACAVHKYGILVSGGSYSGEYLATVEWWDGSVWSSAGSLRVARDYHSMSFHRDTAVVFGGFYISGFTNHYLDSLEMYDLYNMTRPELADNKLATARRRFAVAQLPDHLFSLS